MDRLMTYKELIQETAKVVGKEPQEFEDRVEKIVERLGRFGAVISKVQLVKAISETVAS